MQKLSAGKFHSDLPDMRATVGFPASFRLDAGRLDYFGPFLGFVSDELAEVGGRARQRRTTHIDEPRLHFGIGEASIDLVVEFLDDLGRRGLWCADAEPGARLETRHKFVYGREVVQRIRATRGGYCEARAAYQP